MVNYTTPSGANMNTPDGRASMFAQVYFTACLDVHDENIRVVMETPLDVLDGMSIKEFVAKSRDNYARASQLVKAGVIDVDEILASPKAKTVALQELGQDILYTLS